MKKLYLLTSILALIAVVVMLFFSDNQKRTERPIDYSGYCPACRPIIQKEKCATPIATVPEPECIYGGVMMQTDTKCQDSIPGYEQQILDLQGEISAWKLSYDALKAKCI
jgi:hypothetical protein